MAVVREPSLRRIGTLSRSRSEGTLIDLEDSSSSPQHGNLISYSDAAENSDWSAQMAEAQHTKTTNPFWNKLSGSNPFLDDIVQRTSEAKDLSGAQNEDSVSSSSDENNFSHALEWKRKSFNRSARWRSASDVLEDLRNKVPKREARPSSSGLFMSPDFEWLKNDREAYKMAWLSHRQLTRSCLDLGVISQSPGWAQTQAADTHAVGRVDCGGGSVELPDAGIAAHVPQGHVLLGEAQEISLKAHLDPPKGLNNSYISTVSPLLEVSVSNLNVKESILLEMKLAAEVKKDPLSQVMTTFVGLVAHRKEGSYQKVSECSVLKNTLKMRLGDLRPRQYVIAVAEASLLQPPASSVWDYLERRVAVAVYGPKHIHPSFRVLILVSSHSSIPQKLPFSDPQRGSRNLPPLLLHLWGKEEFSPGGLRDLHFSTSVAGSKFEVKAGRQVVTADQLKLGEALHLPLELSKTLSGEMSPFDLAVSVSDSKGLVLTSFSVTSPDAPPLRCEKQAFRRADKRREVRSLLIPEEGVQEHATFQDRPVNAQWYGVALKSVLRQPRVEYLLEYFKGDTVVILSMEKVRSAGQSKVKEWYIACLRGRIGLVHSKNVKLITREQVIDFSGLKVTAQTLLDNMTLPFKKLTYMYAAIQTLVTERVSSWAAFAGALGYSGAAVETMVRSYAETEAEKVACVLEKLKEDCHTDKRRRKFQHELMIGLLKMDAQGLVAHLIQNTVILSTAVELGVRWRELAERLGRLSGAQIAAYEAPHRGKSGEVSSQSMWKPAYDFLHLWSMRYGEGYRDMIQDLHLALDKMKNPVTKHWRQITGALITANCMEILSAAAFPKLDGV
ncbi:metastasis-associated in colon cancer protein 1 [Denticeps clupeoides]|uniref:Uncharacterized protein n=1 Tax=Denticeps clupeoides TaxID=299321 RepID=A0AAY4C2B3_9TELE|nr:metastasis-associated in colon cancer protein 1 [Denticeps clupeoides]